MPRPRGHGPGYEQRRTQIIDAAAALFARSGFNATSLDDICAATSLGRGALYRYIGSKANLLVEVQNRVLLPLLERAIEIRDGEGDPAQRLFSLSEALLTMMTDKLDHVWVYQHDYRALAGRARERVIDQRHEFEGIVQGLIEAGVDAGQFRALDERLAMLQFLNMHNYTYQWWHPSSPWEASDLAREYCRTLFAGFAADDWQWDS